MTAITDNIVEQRVRQAISNADWRYEQFQVGAYVRLRSLPKLIGRITERIMRNADREAIMLLRTPYVVYRVRYTAGQIFDEHPEHLDLAERPVLKLVG